MGLRGEKNNTKRKHDQSKQCQCPNGEGHAGKKKTCVRISRNSVSVFAGKKKTKCTSSEFGAGTWRTPFSRAIPALLWGLNCCCRSLCSSDYFHEVSKLSDVDAQELFLSKCHINELTNSNAVWNSKKFGVGLFEFLQNQAEDRWHCSTTLPSLLHCHTAFPYQQKHNIISKMRERNHLSETKMSSYVLRRKLGHGRQRLVRRGGRDGRRQRRCRKRR